MDRDRMQTELWRSPFDWVPKVQSGLDNPLISQAKGQSALTSFLCIALAQLQGFCICIFAIAAPLGAAIFDFSGGMNNERIHGARR